MRIIKKRKGSIDSFGVPLLTIVVLTCFFTIIITTCKASNKKDNADYISREYLLKMESEGVLTNSDKSMLVDELKKIGAKNINIDNTCLNKKDYGEKIALKFKCDIPIETMTFNWNGTKRKVNYITKEYNITSISKGK